MISKLYLHLVEWKICLKVNQAIKRIKQLQGRREELSLIAFNSIKSLNIIDLKILLYLNKQVQISWIINPIHRKISLRLSKLHPCKSSVGLGLILEPRNGVRLRASLMLFKNSLNKLKCLICKQLKRIQEDRHSRNHQSQKRKLRESEH